MDSEEAVAAQNLQVRRKHDLQKRMREGSRGEEETWKERKGDLQRSVRTKKRIMTGGRNENDGASLALVKEICTFS